MIDLVEALDRRKVAVECGSFQGRPLHPCPIEFRADEINSLQRCPP